MWVYAMPDGRAIRLSGAFAVQLVNSIVHHATHPAPLFGSISAIDLLCCLTLVVTLVYVGYQGRRSHRPLISGALWALLLWIFGVCASAAVMRLVDAASMDENGLIGAATAALVLAPVALALGALGARRASRGPQIAVS